MGDKTLIFVQTVLLIKIIYVIDQKRTLWSLVRASPVSFRFSLVESVRYEINVIIFKC